MAQDTFFTATFELHLQGRFYNLDQPVIMGILNANPDSFYDGGRYETEREWLLQAEKMILEGVDFIDIGGISSRPGSAEISLEEEKNRILPVIKSIRKNFNHIPLSVDTFRSEIAAIALEEGVSIINDISGGRWDEHIFQKLKDYDSTMVIMHSRGSFSEIHAKQTYSNIAKNVIDDLKTGLKKAENTGLTSIVIDPGFGFSKTIEQNFELLENLDQFHPLNLPVLAGISRKSMIWKTLQVTPENALNGTTALHMICLQKGARILRVHDVKEAKETIQLYSKLNHYGKKG